ncbi:MAG: PAS domain S-box protein [Planctomycetes bacterium]|nr:PAS domain S-box protein [Planctomycetota bacterium]
MCAATRITTEHGSLRDQTTSADQEAWKPKSQRLTAAEMSARGQRHVAAALDPIITVSATGVILNVSESVLRVFGWQPAELVGRNVSVLIPEPHRSSHNEYIERYARTGENTLLGRPLELRAVRRDGAEFPIEMCMSRAETNRPEGPQFVAIIRDISDRVRLGHALAEQKRFYETIIEHMPDIVFRLDRALRHLFIGGALDRLGGLRAHEFVGKTGRELGFPAGVCDQLESVCKGVFAGGDAGEVDVQLGEAWFHCRIVPERTGEGVIATLLGVAEDVTQRKKIEEELAGHRDRLERLVEARARELRRSHEQMRMADRMASIGTLAAGLGHDMNNVLLPVRAHLNAALAASRPPCRPTVRACVRQVRRSVDYLQQLADGLHFLAADPERENGGGPGECTALAKWWSQTGALLSKPVPRHVRVTASFPRTLPEVAMAPHQLTQAVLNLIVNSGQAIPPPADGKGRSGLVRVGAAMAGKGRGGGVGREMVCLSVRDNGTGMTDEVRRRAFEMFFTTKPRGLGSGLGLPLVARLVNNAGGSVTVDSKPGKGTTVNLYLPAAERAAAASLGGHGGTAVISLTSPRTANVVRQMIAAAGYRVLGERERAGAAIWIADAKHATPARVRAWSGARGGWGIKGAALNGRTFVLVGPVREQDQKRWTPLRPVLVEAPDDFISLRDAVGRAVVRQQAGATR